MSRLCAETNSQRHHARKIMRACFLEGIHVPSLSCSSNRFTCAAIERIEVHFRMASEEPLAEGSKMTSPYSPFASVPIMPPSGSPRTQNDIMDILVRHALCAIESGARWRGCKSAPVLVITFRERAAETPKLPRATWGPSRFCGFCWVLTPNFSKKQYITI